MHGYPHIGNRYDIEFERLCQSEAPDAYHVDRIQPADVYYIYRWVGTGSYHFSTLGADGQEQQKVAAYVAQQATRGQIPQGDIRLQPQWKADYGALVQTYLMMPPTAQDAPQTKHSATAQATNPPPITCFDTIDGRLDLDQFEPGFFFPERFFGRPRQDFLRRHGELYRSDFFVIDALKLVYLSVPKVACTAIKLALAKASDGTKTADYEYGPFGEVLRSSGTISRTNPIPILEQVSGR
ncbi:MAG: hypothetical protein HC814_06845 [Rhodobacteraceae bacterium]|nr:hypothetical protein [Paracoccaceae bacterium]